MSRRRKPKLAPTFVLVRANNLKGLLTSGPEWKKFLAFGLAFAGNKTPERQLQDALEVVAAFCLFMPFFVSNPPESWLCDDKVVTKDEVCFCNGTLARNPESGPESIVTEWQLVCDSDWVPHFILSLQMFGMLLGNILASFLADVYDRGGRSLLWDYTFVVGTGQLLSAFATNPYLYAACRFVTGIGLAGLLGIPSGFYTEDFKTEWYRPLCETQTSFAAGVFRLTLLGSFCYTGDWRRLTFMTWPEFLLIAIRFQALPASQRLYLLRCPNQLRKQGKPVQEERVREYFAKMLARSPRAAKVVPLKIVTPDDTNILKVFDGTTNSAQPHETATPVLESDEHETGLNKHTFWNFLTLLSRTDFIPPLPVLKEMVIVCIAATTYYGLWFNVGNMPGNFHVIITLLTFADATAYPQVLTEVSTTISSSGYNPGSTIGKIARSPVRTFMAAAAIFLGILTITASWIPALALICLGMIARGCVSGGLNCARIVVARDANDNGTLQTPWLKGCQLAAIATSLGAVLAPWIAYFGSYWTPLPYLVFTLTSACVALFSPLLPSQRMMPLYGSWNCDRIPPIIDHHRPP